MPYLSKFASIALLALTGALCLPAHSAEATPKKKAHPAAAQECDGTFRHPRVLNRFERKNHTLAGRSARRGC